VPTTESTSHSFDSSYPEEIDEQEYNYVYPVITYDEGQEERENDYDFYEETVLQTTQSSPVSVQQSTSRTIPSTTSPSTTAPQTTSRPTAPATHPTTRTILLTTNHIPHSPSSQSSHSLSEHVPETKNPQPQPSSQTPLIPSPQSPNIPPAPALPLSYPSSPSPQTTTISPGIPDVEIPVPEQTELELHSTDNIHVFNLNELEEQDANYVEQAATVQTYDSEDEVDYDYAIYVQLENGPDGHPTMFFEYFEPENSVNHPPSPNDDSVSQSIEPSVEIEDPDVISNLPAPSQTPNSQPSLKPEVSPKKPVNESKEELPDTDPTKVHIEENTPVPEPTHSGGFDSVNNEEDNTYKRQVKPPYIGQPPVFSQGPRTPDIWEMFNAEWGQKVSSS